MMPLGGADVLIFKGYDEDYLPQFNLLCAAAG